MKVAYIVGGLPFGGVENMLLDTVRELNSRDGVEPIVINISGTGQRNQDFIDAGIRVISIGKSKKTIKTFRLDTVKKLRDILKTERPDIIQTAHFSGDYFGRLATIGLGIPVITNICNPRVEKRWFRRVANVYLSRFTTAYISISKEVREVVQKYHNKFNRENILLYNAIDGKRFESAETADLSLLTGKGGRFIISVGRLVPEKNFAGLIEGFAIIKDSFPDTNLIIVGEGRERKGLEALIENYALKERAFLPGYRSDIPSLLKGADFFALVSHTEGFGNTHLEAMFVGLPTLISNRVPTAEISENAALVSTTDSKDIAEKLSLLLEDTKMAAVLARRGKEIASGYTIDRYADRLTEIYGRLLAGNGK